MQPSLFFDEHFNEGRPWRLEKEGYPFLYHMYWADTNRLWHRNTIFEGYNDSDTNRIKDRVSNYVFTNDVEEIVRLVEGIKSRLPQITLCTKINVANVERLRRFVHELP